MGLLSKLLAIVAMLSSSTGSATANERGSFPESIPEIGDVGWQAIRGSGPFCESGVGTLVSPAQIDCSKVVFLEGVEATIAVDSGGLVSQVEVCDDRFVTPDGASPGMRFHDVDTGNRMSSAYPGDWLTMMGYAHILFLKSGWLAVHFDQKEEADDEISGAEVSE